MLHRGTQGVVYCTGESSFAAVIEFTGEFRQHARSTVFGALYPHAMPFRVVAAPGFSLPMAAVVQTLDFIGKKDYWFSYLQGQALRPLSREDFHVLASRLQTKGAR
ncbi:MAG: hypothetical protein AABY18_01175 [Candidatus Thermoplasmatota archaeon]